MDRCHMMFEIHCVIENGSLSLTDMMRADDRLLLAQVDILDMVPHVRHTAKFTRPLLI